MPRLSIIVVTFNSAGHISTCLEALRAHPPRASHEILVVDNASTDDTQAIVARDWPGVQLLQTGANLGFGVATNRGIRATTSERLLLLNPDAAVTSGAVDTLMETLDRDERVAIAGPRIVDDTGRAELSFGPHIGPLAELTQKVRVAGHARGWPVVAASVERATTTPQFPDWVSGACWMARRSALDAVGLFDERFFLYTEDVDLCARVRTAGHRVAFVPAAVVRHVRGASRTTVAQAAAAQAHYRRSQLAFYEKYHPRVAPLLRTYLMLKGALPDTTTQQ
ncbi:MAG TPA: glycosyltransferase family 2 protein [Vicinamibacterales bacterium]